MANKDIRIPPQDLDAEQSVLGALMIDKSAIASVDDILMEEDFYKKANGIIYGAMFKLWGENEPIDILSVTNKLRGVKELKDIGGEAYLAELVNSVPTASNIAHYSRIVQRKRILRDLIGASYDIAQLGYREEEDIDVLLVTDKKKFAKLKKEIENINIINIKKLHPIYQTKKDLEKNSLFLDIVLPVSNLASDKDIHFSITLTGDY